MNTPITQLKKVMTERGAIFSDESIASPIHFGSHQQEELASQKEAVLFDLSSHKLLQFTGNDRIQWMHNFCTNDIKNLQTNHWCEAFIPDIKSHALGHGLIFAEEDSLWFETFPAQTETLLTHFEKYTFLDNVTLHDRTEEQGLLLLSGPNAKKLIHTTELPNLNETCTILVAGTECRVARVDRLGQPGYLLRLPKAQLTDVWLKLVALGVQPAGSETFNTLRIIAGYPLYGIDISENELVQEVNRSSQAISFTKGCYLGQEPIARIDSLGHVNRKLCSLEIATTVSSDLDSPTLYNGADDQEIGKITSLSYSHRKEAFVALGYVKTKAIQANNIEMTVRVNNVPVSVTLMPTE